MPRYLPNTYHIYPYLIIKNLQPPEKSIIMFPLWLRRSTGTQNLHGLQNLPIELLVQVGNHLPSNSLLSLRYTCRRFSQLYTISVISLKATPNCSEAHNEQWIDFLAMLERDHRLLDHRIVCSGCLTTHHFSKFNYEQRLSYPQARKCDQYLRKKAEGELDGYSLFD